MPYKNPADHRANTKKWYYSEQGRKLRELRRHRMTEQHKRYRQSLKGKIVQRRKAKKMREKYPEKWSARSKLRYAVKVGKILKLVCEKCGVKETFAHHPDYSKPLEVIWLCRQHHREVHGNKH